MKIYRVTVKVLLEFNVPAMCGHIKQELASHSSMTMVKNISDPVEEEKLTFRVNADDETDENIISKVFITCGEDFFEVEDVRCCR